MKVINDLIYPLIHLHKLNRSVNKYLFSLILCDEMRLKLDRERQRERSGRVILMGVVLVVQNHKNIGEKGWNQPR